MKRAVLIFGAVLLGLVALGAVAMGLRHGGGAPYPDLSTEPQFPASELEMLASLDEPPGNMAVAADGRIFLTIHPESRPENIKLAELVNGTLVAFPGQSEQEELWVTPLGVVVDRQNRLWVIDHGLHGMAGARLVSIDLASNTVIDRFDFPDEVAGALSFLQDLQIDPEGRYVYIADVTVFGNRPALVVYDSETRTARRLLEDDASVRPQDYVIRNPIKDMVFFGGLFVLKPGVDSIGIDRQGEWLYYAAMTHEDMFRVRTADLNNEQLSAAELSERVETVGQKPLSDGISVDSEQNVYITDVEHNAIVRLSPDRRLQTVIRDERMRWPDSLCYGPDDYLYVADSAIPDLMLRSKDHIRQSAPYHVYRFRPGTPGLPGQ